MILQDVTKRKVTLARIDLNTRALRLQQLTIYERATSNEKFFSVNQLLVEYNYLRLLALPTKPIGSLRRIVIYSPELHVTLAKNSDVYQWLTTRRKASKDPLRAEVELRNG